MMGDMQPPGWISLTSPGPADIMKRKNGGSLMENLFAKYGLEPWGAAPNHRHMEWYRRGKTAFIHFTVNTFTDREWGDGTTPCGGDWELRPRVPVRILQRDFP